MTHVLKAVLLVMLHVRLVVEMVATILVMLTVQTVQILQNNLL